MDREVIERTNHGVDESLGGQSAGSIGELVCKTEAGRRGNGSQLNGREFYLHVENEGYA